MTFPEDDYELTVVINGKEEPYAYCMMLIDDELRDKIRKEFAHCTIQKFMDEYCRRHKQKYNEEFTVN